MIATLPRDVLLAAVARVLPATPDDAKAAPAHLAAIRLEALPGALALRATDTLVWAATEAPATVDAGGAVLVGAESLRKAVEALPDGDARLALEGTRLVLRVAKRRVELAVMPADLHPDPPALATAWHELPAAQLAELLRQGGYAASDDYVVAQRARVLIERGNGWVTAGSTDGHRLALAKVVVDPGPAFQVQLHARARAHLERLAADAETVAFGETEQYLWCRVGAATLAARRVVAPWVDLEDLTARAMDAPPTTTVVVDAEALRALLRSLDKVAHTEAVVLEARPGLVRLSTETSERGAGADVLPAEVRGTGWVSLSRAYLADAVKALAADRVEIAWAAPAAPVAIRAAGDDSVLAVVMPRDPERVLRSAWAAEEAAA